MNKLAGELGFLIPVLICGLLCTIDIMYVYINRKRWSWQKICLIAIMPCAIAMLTTAVILDGNHSCPIFGLIFLFIINIVTAIAINKKCYK